MATIYTIELNGGELSGLQDALEWAIDMDEDPDRFRSLMRTLDGAWGNGEDR